MDGVLITVSAVAGAVLAGGAYLRWATAPVVAAYRIGVIIGRAHARKAPAG